MGEFCRSRLSSYENIDIFDIYSLQHILRAPHLRLRFGVLDVHRIVHVPYCLVPVARDAGPGEQASREQGGTTHPPSASEHEHTMKILNKLLTENTHSAIV